MNQNMIPELYKLTDKIHALNDAQTLIVKALKNTHYVTPQPGQFNMLYIFGVGEIPISISGYGEKEGFYTHTIKNVGAVSKHLCQLSIGEQLGLRGPFGSCWPLDKARGKNLVVVAGGIGLAPLRPVLLEIIRNRDLYGHVSLVYGAKTVDGLLYLDELREWEDKHDIDVKLTVDQGTANWQGNVGMVTAPLARISGLSDQSLAFLCGPEIMFRYAAKELMAAGLSQDNIHIAMERNMKCALGHCGHCQYGPHFICKDGPIFSYQQVKNLLLQREL